MTDGDEISVVEAEEWLENLPRNVLEDMLAQDRRRREAVGYVRSSVLLRFCLFTSSIAAETGEERRVWGSHFAFRLHMFTCFVQTRTNL
jgi:hypothetical protein